MEAPYCSGKMDHEEGDVMAVCGAGVRLPTVSQLHRNIVWVKTWPSPLGRAPLVCSIPAHGKALGAGEGGECGKEQNSIPENGDFLPHLLSPTALHIPFSLSPLSTHLKKRAMGLPQA